MAAAAALLVLATLVGGALIGSVAAATSPRSSTPDAVRAAGPSPSADPSRTTTADACAEFRRAFAAELGVDESALGPAAKAAARTVIDAAVANGRITKARAERLEGRIEAAPGDGCGLLAGRLARARATAALGVVRDGVQAAADTLKLTPAELRARLRTGATLKAIAAEAGVPYETLTAAVVAAVKADLDKAVARGTIRQPRADRILERLERNLAAGRFREPRRAMPDASPGGS
jgi:ribosomal protein S20